MKQSEREGWYTGFLVELSLVTDCVIRFHPIVMRENGIDRAEGEEAEAIMSAFAQRNAHLEDGHWLEGWRDFCLSLKELYLSVVGGAYSGSAERKTKCLIIIWTVRPTPTCGVNCARPGTAGTMTLPDLATRKQPNVSNLPNSLHSCINTGSAAGVNDLHAMASESFLRRIMLFLLQNKGAGYIYSPAP